MESVKNIITFFFFSITPHLCSAGSVRCLPAEGSWKTWPGVSAAPRGWCSWSFSCTRWPGVPGRPCGSWPRRLRRKRMVAQRGGGKGEGTAVEGWGARAAERGRQVCSEREGQGQTGGKAPTERRGRMAEQLARGRSFSVSCRRTSTGTHTRQEKVILTVTLSTSGGLERRKAVGHWARWHKSTWVK